MNKYLFIGLVLIVSCAKELPYDAEENMDKGRATLLNKCYVVDTFSTYLTAKAEFVYFDALQSFSSYDTFSFAGMSLYGSNTEITGSYSQNSSKIAGYKNLIIVNTDNLYWLESFSPGYYLNRYFGIVQKDPNCEAGVASFGINSNYLPVFQNEFPGEIFSNSSNFNTTAFYDVTRTSNINNSGNAEYAESSLTETLNALQEVIDSLSDYANPTIKTTITLFTQGNFYFSDSDLLQMEPLIDQAQTANISINIIATYSSLPVLQLSSLTGGFYYTSNGCLTIDGEYVNCEDQNISGVGVILQNLNDILYEDYTKHIVEFEMNKTNVTEFQDTDYPFCALQYNSFIYPIALRKKP